MSQQDIWLIAIAIIAVDLLVFVVPVVPLVAVYILLARPRWFKQFVDDLYEKK
jgi:hypothetical protein